MVRVWLPYTFVYTQQKGSIQSQNMAPPINFQGLGALLHFHYFISIKKLILWLFWLYGSKKHIENEFEFVLNYSIE